MRTAVEIGNTVLRDELAVGLAKCTEAQVAVFKRMYPSGSPSDAQLETAVDQVLRTVARNESKEASDV